MSSQSREAVSFDVASPLDCPNLARGRAFAIGADVTFLVSPVPTGENAVRSVVISCNGERLDARCASFIQIDRTGQSLLVSVCDRSFIAGDALRWTILNDQHLVDGIVGSDVSISSAEASEEFGRLIGEQPQPSAFLRRICEACFVYLNRSNDHLMLSAFRVVLAGCQLVQDVQVLGAYSLTENSALLEFRFPSDAQQPDAVAILDRASYRNGIVRPIRIDAADVILLPIMVDATDFHETTIVLWGDTDSWLLDLSSIPILSIGFFLGRIEAYGPSFPWFRQCQEAIGICGNGAPELNAVLNDFRVFGTSRERSHDLIIGDNLRVGISTAVRAPDGNMSVFGWIEDPFSVVDDIVWEGPNGLRQSIRKNSITIEHREMPSNEADATDGKPQKELKGFLGSVRTPAPAIPFSDEYFTVVLRSGLQYRVHGKTPPANARRNRDLLLTLPRVTSSNSEAVLEIVSPAVASCHGEALRGRQVDQNLYFGTPLVETPRLSIIVPIYQNWSFLKAQYTAIAIPELPDDLELIYVVDDPGIFDSVSKCFRDLVSLYGLPVRLLGMNENYGYAAAVNAGLEVARSELVLFLNSDCIPLDDASIGVGIECLKRQPKVSLVGGKLLFANGGLQHAGISFYVDTQGRVFNRSPFKGYPATHGAARRGGKVDAVTGAAMFARRAQIVDLGGFSEEYIVGDFEDTDLCFRVRDSGGEIFYEPKSLFMHFERQSIGLHETHQYSCAELYNQRLHQNRWFGASYSRVAEDDLQRFGHQGAI